MFATPLEVIDHHNVLRTTFDELDAAYDALHVRYCADTQALYNELNDVKNNLALANAELRNLRQWRDATEHMMM